VLEVLTQDQPQVPLADDQHPVQALATRGGRWKSTAPRSRSPGGPDRGLDDPQADRGEDCIECRSELGVAIPDQELAEIASGQEPGERGQDRPVGPAQPRVFTWRWSTATW
jgi:hypothetical protein